MSQKGDFENDIWEYKSLGKRKKRGESLPASATVSKRSCVSGKTSKGGTAFSVKSAHKKDSTAANGDYWAVVDTPVEGHGTTEAQNASKSSPDNDTFQTDSDAEGSPGNFCPMCQMPFSILVVQSQRWHVAECLDTPRDSCKCPDGLQCSSTYPNHYKKFNHTLLAHSRAESDGALLSESQQAGIGRETCLQLINSKVEGSVSETSQDSFTASPHNSQSGTPCSKLTNGLLLLRSPGPEDFKKKKGWSSSTKGRKSVSASQESKTQLSSTPVKTEGGGQTCEPKHPDSGDSICYSPLSEFPAETEVAKSECRKALFNVDAPENENEDSMELFSDSFLSEDEVLAEFIDNLETHNVQVKEHASLNTQLESVTSAPPTNQLAASLVAENRAGATGACGIKSSIQSPQSIVLERLRETLQSSESLALKSLYDSTQPHASSPQVPSSPSSIVERSQTMPPQKGKSKTGQASCLKQTDIGVFFGLKPLKEKETKTESVPNQVNATSVSTLAENPGRPRQPRKERQRKSRADVAADTSQAIVEKNGEDIQGEAGKGRSRGWRGRRWNRTNADGEAELPRCPFYKKIPTKFAVDAFQYGAIEGISTYFLTHFHSDHYGGLTKNSTFPIYCNRITGNLVKSKLRVEEQYVRILPMNTQVTVEGVTVVLLDANCPGAAMLLFFLPDGQTVLHTGDFRADPSMETYPELLSCRVQTLYLDTYCSPEYTFPRQQEVIRFAASSAFELVTLNPRTLVVCGSYSVGKEKVFLLADVLGSKVCLSRDKYNTMCCLESERVRKHITTDWKAAQVHVLPMMQLSFKQKLQHHLARFSGQYDQLVAFKPTGWTFSQQVDSVDDIQPQISGNISIYGIPYSEHSSFLEMKRFVQWLKPLKIIPTVNNGSWASRKAMEKCFSEWLT
uniref:DNA cross-link repair 1A protein n=1 Tax=Mola mola TaxID=94237 RepID=A0A3Q4BGP3_MOLML